MRPGRPKQHVHNWVRAVTFKKFVEDSTINCHSWGYFPTKWYNKCVKGGVVKHTKKDKWHFEMYKDYYIPLLPSGSPYFPKVR